LGTRRIWQIVRRRSCNGLNSKPSKC